MRTQVFFLRIRRFAFVFAACYLANLTDIVGQGSLEQFPFRQQADSMARISQSRQAIEWLNAAKTDLEQQGKAESLEYVAVLLATRVPYCDLGAFDLAEKNVSTAINLQQQIQPGDLENQIILLRALADAYEVSGDPLRAIPVYEKALDLRLIVSGANSHAAAKGYYDLATIYLVIQNFEKANEYCLKAIRTMKSAGLTEHPDYGGYHQVLGLIYQEEGDFPNALKYYQEALLLLQAKLGEHYETALVLSTIGETYAQLRDVDKALEFQFASRAMFEKVDGPSSAVIPIVDYFIAQTYNIGQQPQKALEYLQRVQGFYAKQGEGQSAGPQIFLALSDTYRMLGQYDQALAFADSACLGLQDATGIGRLRFWRALLTKANVLSHKFQQTQNTATLVEAGQLLAEAQSTMSAFISGFQNERDKLVFYREAFYGFDLAIEVYVHLYEATRDLKWLKLALEVSETSKGLLLYQQILENTNLLQHAIPEALANEEHQLYQQTLVAKKQRFELGEQADVAEKDALEEQIFSLNRRLEKVSQHIQVFQKNNGIAAKGGFPDISFSATQASLATGEGLLEFFVGDTTVSAFLLRPDTLIFRKLGQTRFVQKQTALLRESIGRYFIAPEKNSDLYLRSANDYTASAETLYRLLIAPFGNFLPDRLIIVPDGVLAYLPFEALLVEKPVRPDRFHLHHYFAKDATIRYAYSATLLQEMETQTQAPNATGNLLAMAPFFEGATTWIDSLNSPQASRSRTGMIPLPYSGEEVYKIAKMMDGTALTGMAASKNAFMQEAGKYRVLHLATHAQANEVAGDYSFLVFAQGSENAMAGRLYVSEISGLRLNAELVALSACETGLGQMHRGEGIISIARAFASAGAHSIVQSQWAVSDAQTRRLMELFYGNLKNKQAKDVALQKAQMVYLTQYAGEQAHPYFWAGFILIGDNKPLR